MSKAEQITKGVLAGIVTYNPEIERLRENILSIASQVSKVLIVDNCSANLDEIKALADATQSILVANTENSGLGVALNQVMLEVEAQGLDFAYLLDQDSVSCAGMIEALMAHTGQDVAIVSPRIVDRNKLDRVTNYVSDVELFDRPITSGSLVPARVWRKVGGFDEKLFIEFVDYEFDERCLQAGYKNVQVNTISLLQEGGHAEKSRLVSGIQKDEDGKLSLKHPYRYNYSPMRDYYRYRNMYIFMRRFGDKMTSLKQTKLQMKKQLVHDLVIEKPNLESLKAIRQGIKDGKSVSPEFVSALVDKDATASKRADIEPDVTKDGASTVGYLSADEIKLAELEILKAFDSFCNKHELSYSLCGGTLLGAVRHQGFIPWDDDIDVAMPRPDYEKLVKSADLFALETGFELEGLEGTPVDHAPIIKVVNKEIAVEGENYLNKDYLWVDIIPIDGLPEAQDGLESIYKRIKRARRNISLVTASPKSASTLVRRVAAQVIGPIVRLVPNSLNAFLKKVDDLAQRVPYGSTPYVGAVSWGMYGPGERMPIDGFEKKVYLQFEDSEFPCPSCWDEYLTGIYGDYMQLPPEDKRVTHELKAWRVSGDEVTE